MAKSRLLMNEHPIVINKETAKIFGLNGAIVLQQINYWLNINELANKNFKDGYYWTYNTVEEWSNEFPFWSYDTVKRTLKKLRDEGILITGKYNVKGYDQTLWYRINYEKLDKIEEEYYNESSIGAKCPNEENQCIEEDKNKKDDSNHCNSSLVQNAPMEEGKMPQCNSADCPNQYQRFPSEIPSEISLKEEEETIKDLIVKNFDIKIGDKRRESIQNLIKNNTIELIYKAIDIAIDNNAKNPIKYIETTLLDWSNKNISSVDEVNNLITSWKEKNKKAKENKETKIKKAAEEKTIKSKDSFNNFEQRQYDYKKLEEDLLGYEK